MRETQHPTSPPPEPQWYAAERVRFGGLSDRGEGYAAYSQRSGPGVLVLHPEGSSAPSARAFANGLARRGFTALVPDLPEDLRVLGAAAAHLAQNWHPRLGVVGLPGGGGLALRVAAAVGCDATVIYGETEGEVPPAGARMGPVLVHLPGGGAALDADRLRRELAGAGIEAEIVVGPGEPGLDNLVAPAGEEADASWEITVDFLLRHLS